MRAPIVSETFERSSTSSWTEKCADTSNLLRGITDNKEHNNKDDNETPSDCRSDDLFLRINVIIWGGVHCLVISNLSSVSTHSELDRVAHKDLGKFRKVHPGSYVIHT